MLTRRFMQSLVVCVSNTSTAVVFAVKMLEQVRRIWAWFYVAAILLVKRVDKSGRTAVLMVINFVVLVLLGCFRDVQINCDGYFSMNREMTSLAGERSKKSLSNKSKKSVRSCHEIEVWCESSCEDKHVKWTHIELFLLGNIKYVISIANGAF